MRAKLKTTLIDSELGLKETFATLKGRLLDGQDFLQVTGENGKKYLFNKSVVGVLSSEKSLSLKKKSKKKKKKK